SLLEKHRIQLNRCHCSFPSNLQRGHLKCITKINRFAPIANAKKIRRGTYLISNNVELEHKFPLVHVQDAVYHLEIIGQCYKHEHLDDPRRTEWQGFPSGTKAATWEITNSLIMGWLIHSMVPEIGEDYLSMDTAQDIWEAVATTYSRKGNFSKAFELCRSIEWM
ncbi:Allantoinase, partial [Camellia lanceoleosa]